MAPPRSSLFCSSAQCDYLFLLQSLQQLCWGILAVALGVVVDPPPQVGAGILHLQLGLPVQLLVGQAGVGCEVENITLSALDDVVLEIAANHCTKGLDHLEDSAATARAQVPGFEAGLAVTQVVQRS